MLTANTTDTVNTLQKNNSQILVVDDEADIRYALSRILRLEGYGADRAASGAEALEMLSNKTYDLMILDMRMPEMDGTEVMQQVQERYPDLLIIILTGQATLESAIVATKSDNVVDYLLKPAGNDEFIQAVKTALQKQAKKIQQQQLLNAATQMLSVMQTQETGTRSGSIAEASLPASVPPTADSNLIHTPLLTLNRQKRLVTNTNAPRRVTELTKGEAAILAWFMTHPNQIVSCYELVTQALGYETTEEEADGVIRPYIFRLRRKVEPHPKNPRLICTVRRKGYRFNCPSI